MNETIKNSLILCVITLVAGFLLGATYFVTKEPIAEQKIIQRDMALENVMSDASFEAIELDISSYPMVQNIFKALKDGETKGYAFKLLTKEGYGGNIELVVGISTEGKITGVDIIKQSETPGLGAKADDAFFKDEFVEKDATSLTVVKGSASSESEITAISGATITSRAVTNAVNEAILCYNQELKEEGK